jgi:hypothetical protein
MTWKGRLPAREAALTHRRTHPHGTARHSADATPSLFSGLRFLLPGTFEGGPISKGSGTCVQIPEPQIPEGIYRHNRPSPTAARKEEVIGCTEYRRGHMRETQAPEKLTRFLVLRDLAALRTSPLTAEGE